MADWTEEQRAEVARVLEAFADEVKAGHDGPRDLDAALDAIWSTVSQDVPDLDVVRNAMRNAKLPDGYQYGPDAMEQVHLGKKIAIAAFDVATGGKADG